MSEVQRYKFCEIKGSMVGSSDGDWCHASHIDAVQSELTTWKTKACEAAEREAALREELAKAKRVGPPHFCGLPMSLNPHPEAGVPGRFLEVGAVSECIPCLVSSRHGWAKTAGDLQQRLAAAEQRNAELQKQLNSIDKHLRGNVNDPDPLPPIMPGAFSYTTTYGLVAGLLRERDYLKKSATPLPAGDDYLRQLAQRLREYVGNPHHIDPLSEAFKRLIDDSAFALSKLAALQPTESGASE